METLLRVERLHKSFEGKVALKNITFDLYEGETLAIVGHNGAGKSTLMNCICKVLKSDSGDIKWSIPDALLYESIGVHQQMNYFEAKAQVKDVLSLYMTITGRKQSHETYLKPYQLEQLMNSEVSKISFGERQKFTLALAMLHNPKVLILDEMTTGVDVMSKKMLWDLIEAIKVERKTTILLVTHDLNEVSRYANRMMIINQGEIVTLKNVSQHEDLEEDYIKSHQ